MDQFYDRSGQRGKYAECKTCHYGRQKRRRARKRAILIAHHGGCCAACEYDRCHAAMDFHHVEPESKSFGLGSAGIDSKSIEELKEESSKCVLLCKNCHAEVHAGKMKVARRRT